MLTLEAKLYGKTEQFKALDEAIRTAQFIRNYCIRHWIDNTGVGQYDLSALTAVAPQYTSINCSSCGEEVRKTLSTRTHKCKCGLVLNPDRNAALNILAKGLEMLGVVLPNTVGRTEINAWGETNLCLIGVTQLDKLIRSHQESAPLVGGELQS